VPQAERQRIQDEMDALNEQISKAESEMAAGCVV
jgi:hypothetical protein